MQIQSSLIIKVSHKWKLEKSNFFLCLIYICDIFLIVLNFPELGQMLYDSQGIKSTLRMYGSGFASVWRLSWIL